MQEWSLIKGQYNTCIYTVCACTKTDALKTEIGEKNVVSLENYMFPHVNVVVGVVRAHPLCLPPLPPTIQPSPLVLCFHFFGTLLQPFTLSSTHLLSAHPSSASPSETPNPFILYLSADEVVKLSFIPLPCPPLSLPFDGGSKSLYCAAFFFRYKLVKTKEILKSHNCFQLHPCFSMQTCLTLPSKSPTGLHSFTAACQVLMLKNTKMPISHHSGWEKKPILQQWKTFTDSFTTS